MPSQWAERSFDDRYRDMARLLITCSGHGPDDRFGEKEAAFAGFSEALPRRWMMTQAAEPKRMAIFVFDVDVPARYTQTLSPAFLSQRVHCADHQYPSRFPAGFSAGRPVPRRP